MAILKCKMCGGDIELSADKTFGTCEFCGSTMTFPKVDDEQRAAMFNRGNHFRRIGEFDKALAVYERIVQEDENDAEAHWCCALCRFGIEYVEDPNTFEYLPTCHRASFDSFLEDVDYLAALEHSDGITRRQYQKDAAKIVEVQRGILATSQNEEPFDVFICYKESEDDGTRTRDSLYAQDIYYQLTEQGRRVFFSRITLEDKAGTEYEPYIFAALNSAKVMILVTTSAEHANAVWVKNEWSRFLSLMRKDRSKLLLPCYRDMDPYDLPEALSVLQSYDMSKIGFIQDLIRGVNKVLNGTKPKQAAKETVVIQQANANVAPLLKRAFMFLEDGDWNNANEYCEKVLDQDPENALAYVGKLMVELHVRKREQLRDQAEPFDGSNNYQKALRFGDEALKQALSGAVVFIKERNENQRKEAVYQQASTLMLEDTMSSCRKAAELFASIPDYANAEKQREKCLHRAEIARKNSIYDQACSQMEKDTIDDLTQAANLFKTIPGWKDVDEQAIACQERIDAIQAQREAERLEAESKSEKERIAEAKARKKQKVMALVFTPIIVVAIAFVVLFTNVILPKQKFEKAMDLLASSDFEAAYALLDEIGDADAIASSKYERAIALISAEDYETAYLLLSGLNYQDSEEQLVTIRPKYQQAVLKKALKKANVGSTVVFGSYEQDGDTANGKEDIEWQVLAKEGNRILVISKYVLDSQEYNASFKAVTWENCSLHTWLNGTFLRTAFSAYEQELIPSVTVTTDKNPSYSTNPGNDTTDQVFLLSIEEACRYFTSDEARRCVPTASSGARSSSYAYSSEGFEHTCNWWLRSPGESRYAASVDDWGHIKDPENYVTVIGFGVRPALWINFDS